jgi:hypothetical protein
MDRAAAVHVFRLGGFEHTGRLSGRLDLTTVLPSYPSLLPLHYVTMEPYLSFFVLYRRLQMARRNQNVGSRHARDQPLFAAPQTNRGSFKTKLLPHP